MKTEDEKTDLIHKEKIIKHDKVFPSELNRPVLPDTQEEKEFWQMSRRAGARTAFIFILVTILLYFFLLNNHVDLHKSNQVDNTDLSDIKFYTK